jgi:hypothetical protein
MIEWAVGIRRAELRRIAAEVASRRGELLAAWRRIHAPLEDEEP